MTDLLFDTPWWLPVLIVAIGVVLFVTGNNRLEAKVKLAGLAVIGLAILLTVTSYFVDTPIEAAERRSRELIDAFEKADWARMTAILDPTTTVSVLEAPVYEDRDKIMEAARSAHGRDGFKSVNVLTMSSEQADTVITVSMTLLSDTAAVGRPMNSDWQFDWQRTADGWTLVDVRALSIGQYSGEQVRNMFPGR